MNAILETLASLGCVPVREIKRTWSIVDGAPAILGMPRSGTPSPPNGHALTNGQRDF